MSTDLTKGSFGHFSSFFVFKISKILKFLTMESNCFLLVIQSKAKIVLIELNDTYNVCCHGNTVHMDYTLPLKHWVPHF